MTAQAFRDLALHYVEEEMSAVRLGERAKMMRRADQAVFLRWLSRRASSDLRAVGKKDLVAYHGHLAKVKSKRTGENLASNTINSRFYSVCVLFSVLYRVGAITENPAHGLKLALPLPSGWKRRSLTRDEINRFLEAIDTDNAQGLKDRTLFELIYSSGLRVAEVAALKIGDIDFERRVMVVRGKFDMDKKEISTHSIRHSTATHLLENGASVCHVKELLGHKCIESTVRYTHVMTDSLARVYRRHHPREHELFEAVDEDYKKRLDSLLVGRAKP